MGKHKGPRNPKRTNRAKPEPEKGSVLGEESRPQIQEAPHKQTPPQIAWRSIRIVVGCIWQIIEKVAVALSFIGVTYLVYDSLYQTAVTMNFAYSDAETAMDNPIAIQNKSNLFSVRNIRWACQVDQAEFEGQNIIKDARYVFPTISIIEPGKTINVACNSKKAGPAIISFGKQKLISANIVMHLSYDADFFGIWTYHRTVRIPFSWVGNIAQPQWVQGEFAK
jgi:hypothetical protein